MQTKPFRFGRLSSSQFQERVAELNKFLSENEILQVHVTSNDEEGTVMFVFFDEGGKPQAPVLKGKSKPSLD